MRILKTIFVFLFLLSLLIGTLIAAERTVLAELFTSTTCGPCLPSNSALDNLREPYYDEFVLIRYHVWWPSPGNDPFYLANTFENECRTYFYGVSGVPNLRLDGRYNIGSDYEAYESSILDRRDDDAPITLDFSVIDDTIVVEINVEEPISSSNLRLIHAIIENNIAYSAPNGQTHFMDVMRDMLVDCDGDVIDLSSRGTYYFKTEYTTNPLWDSEQLQLVVFVQDLSTDEVFQAFRGDLPPMYREFQLSTDRLTTLMLPDSSFSFNVALENIGYSEDYYIIYLEYESTGDWLVNFSAGGSTYESSDTVYVPAGDSEELNVNLQAPTAFGIAKVYMIVQSLLAGTSDTLLFEASTGGPILLVDDDGGDLTEIVYKGVIDNLDVPYGFVSREEGALQGEYMHNYDMLIWFTGSSTSNTLRSDDREAIISYLENGGNLFIIGENIADDLYSHSHYDFMNNYLHARYDGETAGVYWLQGFEDDEIANIFRFMRILSSSNPDIIYPYDGDAWKMFKFGGDSTKCGGIRVETELNKIIFLSFNFESIMDEYDRFNLMRRAIEWMYGYTGIWESESSMLPEHYQVLKSYPNPFNSCVTIEFNGTDKYRSETPLVDIFSIDGKKLTSLQGICNNNGRVHFTWDGKDISGVTASSGLYFVTLEFEGQKYIDKILYLR
ncbi:Omp28-related outer membrane protein [bacterium]|nr:Omp28-related outer membrane protein [bacterium]